MNFFVVYITQTQTIEIVWLRESIIHHVSSFFRDNLFMQWSTIVMPHISVFLSVNLEKEAFTESVVSENGMCKKLKVLMICKISFHFDNKSFYFNYIAENESNSDDTNKSGLESLNGK